MAVLGNVDAGKSTLLGVLTQGELDNGRGRARLNLFRHLHEIQSGRTSSISHEILGFSHEGEVRFMYFFSTFNIFCPLISTLSSFGIITSSILQCDIKELKHKCVGRKT